MDKMIEANAVCGLESLFRAGGMGGWGLVQKSPVVLEDGCIGISR